MITIDEAHKINETTREADKHERLLDEAIRVAVAKKYENATMSFDNYSIRDELERRYKAAGWMTTTFDSDRAFAPLEFKLTVVVGNSLRATPPDPSLDAEPAPDVREHDARG